MKSESSNTSNETEIRVLYNMGDGQVLKVDWKFGAVPLRLAYFNRPRFGERELTEWGVALIISSLTGLLPSRIN